VNLFAALGGVPKFVVCDNLKAAVTNPDRHDPGLNRSYLEMAEYYGTAILPARPGKPPGTRGPAGDPRGPPWPQFHHRHQPGAARAVASRDRQPDPRRRHP
jgi:hypothetical protein